MSSLPRDTWTLPSTSPGPPIPSRPLPRGTLALRRTFLKPSTACRKALWSYPVTEILCRLPKGTFIDFGLSETLSRGTLVLLKSCTLQRDPVERHFGLAETLSRPCQRESLYRRTSLAGLGGAPWMTLFPFIRFGQFWNLPSVTCSAWCMATKSGDARFLPGILQ